MAENRGAGRWLAFGCGGLLLLVVLVVGGVGLRVWSAGRNAELQDHRKTYEGVSAAAPGTVEADKQLASFEPDGAPATVLLEVDSAELMLEPALPGEPLNVEARFDKRSYRLEETLEESDPWNYRLRFTVVGSRLITGIKNGFYGTQPQLRVRLPLDVPIDLKIVQRNGGAIVDLSGLHLQNADFDFEGALLKVDADAPLEGELQTFSVHGESGGLVLESINLMGPETIDVDFRMGQILMDLRGDWAADAQIGLSSGLADVTVRLPRGAAIDGLETTRTQPVTEIPLPRLSFTVEQGKRAKLRVFE